jgi:hypothetical protein
MHRLTVDEDFAVRGGKVTGDDLHQRRSELEWRQSVWKCL